MSYVIKKCEDYVKILQLKKSLEYILILSKRFLNQLKNTAEEAVVSYISNEKTANPAISTKKLIHEKAECYLKTLQAY